MKLIPATQYPAASLHLDDIWQIANLLSDHFERVQIILGDMLIEQPHELAEAATELIHRNNKKYVHSCVIRAENSHTENSKQTDWLSLDIGWKKVQLRVSDLRDPALSGILSQIEAIIKRRRLPQWPRRITLIFCILYGVFFAGLVDRWVRMPVYSPIMWPAIVLLAFYTYKDYSGGVDLRKSGSNP